MAEPLRKYTVRDVRESHALPYVARDYTLNYTGDFEFMVDAQNQVMRGEPLNEHQVKAVLNCMIYDPRAQHLLPPRVQYTPEMAAEMVPPRRRLRVVPEPVRKYPFSTLIQWNMDYLISTWKQTNTCHILDKTGAPTRFERRKSYLEWSPQRSGFVWYLKPVCSARLSQEYIHLVKRPPQGRHMCRWCLIIQEQRASREVR
jgi:hypothetical protein